MSTVGLKPECLPRRPLAYESWGLHRPTYLSVYECVLLAERQAIEQVESNPSDKTAKDDLISARVAGYLLIELWDQNNAFNEIPCLKFAQSLVSPHRDHGDSCKVIFDVGKFYRTTFYGCVRSPPLYALQYLNSSIVRTSTKKYPTPSTHPSRPSFDTKEDMIKEFMEADSKDHKTARHKVRISTYYTFLNPPLILGQALARDGFQCVLTGMFNEVSLMSNSDLAREAEASGNPVIGTVITCHIMNESTMQGVDPSGDGKGDSVVNKVRAIGLPTPFHNLHLSSRQIMPPMLLAFLSALDSRTTSKRSLRKMVFTILEI